MPEINVPAIIEAAISAILAREAIVHHFTETEEYARDDVTAALPSIAEALYAPILALHYPADNDANRTPVCPDCKGLAGVHPCGCWTDTDRQPVCGHCNGGDHRFQSIAYPCPTVLKIQEVLNGLA